MEIYGKSLVFLINHIRAEDAACESYASVAIHLCFLFFTDH